MSEKAALRGSGGYSSLDDDRTPDVRSQAGVEVFAPPPRTIHISTSTGATVTTVPGSGPVSPNSAFAHIDADQPIVDPSVWQYQWETEPITMEVAQKRKADKIRADREHPYRPHQGAYRQYMRDIILGINDGLVSMFLLVIGLIGGGATPRDILLAGITGAIGGAISMALGEFIATKSQSEVMSGDLRLEGDHFLHHRFDEMDQVYTELRTKLKLSGEVLNRATKMIGEDDEAMLNFMKAFEFGFTEQDDRSPIVAMLMSGSLFITGSLPSVVPFFFVTTNEQGLIAASALCGAALAAVGSIKTMATRTNPFWAGFENLAIGVLAAAISFGVGVLYNFVAGDGQSLNA